MDFRHLLWAIAIECAYQSEMDAVYRIGGFLDIPRVEWGNYYLSYTSGMYAIIFERV